jgi:hypothetical protein
LLKAINNSDDRGVKFVQGFNCSIIKIEQKQDLLHAVSEHKQKFPDTEKSFLVAETSMKIFYNYIYCTCNFY